MRRTALYILLSGIIFIFMSIPFAGVDLLIDAVGFLLIFNALHALRKESTAFAPAAVLALILIIPSALQLFLSGTPLLVASIVRHIAEAALFILMFRAFLQSIPPRTAPAYIALLGMCAGALGSILLIVALLAPSQYGSIALTTGTACRFVVLGVLVQMALFPPPHQS